ncbi:MAG: hypothetical protein N2V73_06875 [Candidatus Methanospirare jalkutatii]|nr:hypothetical protein [Candidatus Methanospirare jalkutatii]MCW7080159.1 hypothetical protein [Candidatus Methanospirare jalkutatii]
MHENKKQMKKQKSENTNKKEIPSAAHDFRCQRGKKTLATSRFVAFALGKQAGDSLTLSKGKASHFTYLQTVAISRL